MTTTFARFSLVCALTLAMSGMIAKAGTTAAKITSVKGSAEYSMDGQSWQTLSPGMMLQPGSIIRTSEGSHVDVLLSEGKTAGSAGAAGAAGPALGSLIYFPEAGSEQANMVRIEQSTVLSIDTLTESRTGMSVASDTVLDLRKGSIFFSVKKLSAGSNFEIKTPKGVAGVRGTLGWMNSDGVVRLLRGMMAETYRAPDGVTTRTQVINARQMFDPATGLLQGIPEEMYQELIRIAIEIVRLAGVPVLPSTFVLDPNILVTSPVNEPFDFGSGGGDGDAR